MLIDQKQVEAFYDATLRPNYERTDLTLSESMTKGRSFDGGLTLGAVFPGLFPGLLKGDANASVRFDRQKGKGQETGLRFVTNPYRHLLELAIHYSAQEKLRQRLVFAGLTEALDATGKDVSTEWLEDKFARDTPRAIVVLNLPEETRLIPLAAETSAGEFVPLYTHLAERLKKDGQPELPEYVRRGKPNYQQSQREYWRWFAERFDPQVAIEVVEAASKSGRFAWIAFRVPIGSDDPLQAETFLHLHISPRGEYETGAVAYNFIARGFEHGVRIVGTLKSDPDLNVLAVFER